MRVIGKHSCCHALVLLAAVAIGISGAAANAGLTVIGTQYQQDDPMTEYQCIWHDSNYPTACGSTLTGSNVHVYLKNTGGGSVTVSDVTLAGYSLATVILMNTSQHNAASIYYYWDNPPQAILDSGEPAWYKADPKTIAVGGVAQVVIRLKRVPVTNPVTIGVVYTGGTVSTTVAINASAPQLANIGFSSDRSDVYLSWRRSGGAGPTTIKMDDVDVTANCTTVNDANVNYAATVLTPSTVPGNVSYHVYQGIYSDGSKATASIRTWVNPFIHGGWGGKDGASDLDAAYDTANDMLNRGYNASIIGWGGDIGMIASTAPGRLWLLDNGYGCISDAIGKFTGTVPWAWFLDDEPDAEEDNVSGTFCGTGKKLPCGPSPMGILVMQHIIEGETMRTSSPTTITSVNLDGTFKPDNYYSWGQAVDLLQADPYYQRRLADTYFYATKNIPIYQKATYIHAVSKAMTRAAEPNPTNVALFGCEWRNWEGTDIWPFADPNCRRIEAYYALAGGAKGLSYWWWNAGWPSNGLNDWGPEARALWKAIGLYGVEIKTLKPQIVTSHPIDMSLSPSSNVWAKALISGTDTILLLAVNDNYYTDSAAVFQHTDVANASVVATLPSWMTSSPSAFLVTASGLSDVTTSLNGSNLTVTLGTLDIAKMIVITTNSNLRAQVQAHYVANVWPGVCASLPDFCVPQTSPPSITLHPSNQTIATGGTANFTVGASGSTPLSYQWQRNSVNLTNIGHYSGVTTVTLTISSADSNDATNYRCVVTNAYGSATSNAATLTLTVPTGPIITQQPANQVVLPGSTATFAITATGSGTVTYKWQKNQANVTDGGHYSGTTTATFSIASADTTDSAIYRCVAADSYGSTTSNEASLTVTSNISPTLQNGNFEAGTAPNPPVGWTTYIETSKSGNWTIQTPTPPEGSQWQQTQVYDVSSYGGIRQVVTGLTNGGVYTLSGSYKTNSVSATASVRYTLNSGTDRATSAVLVSKTDSNWTAFSGTVTASGASLMLFLDHLNGTASNKASGFDNIKVTCPPIITLQPTAQSICSGGSASFAVAAIGSGTLTYLWQKNSVNLADGGHYSGCSTATLAITGADTNDATNYRCMVTSADGSTNSNAVALTVKAATAISVPPADLNVAPGATAAFSVTATGDGTLTYQWQKDTINLSNIGHYSGATTATLTVSNADTNDTANYRCMVTGGCGSVYSIDAALIVGQPLPVPGDFNGDGDVDAEDIAVFVECIAGPTVPLGAGCESSDFDGDNDVDQSDFGILQRCYSGENIYGDPHCAD